MPDQLADLEVNIERLEQEHLTAMRKHSGLTPGAREAFKLYEQHRAAADKTAASARYRERHLADDDLTPIVARVRAATEVWAQSSADVERGINGMGDAAVLYHAELDQAAQARLDPAERDYAMQNALMILGGTDSPEGVVLELAQGDDAIAGLIVNTTFAENYLRGQGKGVQHAKDVAATARRVSAASAINSADPQRRAAGQALAEFSKLERSRACTHHRLMRIMDEANEAAQRVFSNAPSQNPPAVPVPGNGDGGQ